MSDMREEAIGLLEVSRTASNSDVAEAAVALAQVRATIFLGDEIKAVREMLGNMLGDDSHLDKLAHAVRDYPWPAGS